MGLVLAVEFYNDGDDVRFKEARESICGECIVAIGREGEALERLDGQDRFGA